MKRISLVLLLLFVFSPSAFAQWELLNDASSIHYVSIKKSKVAEVNSFKTLTGSVSESGKVSLAIDLNSVETNVDIRNKRMKNMLFETTGFAEASITGAVDLTRALSLKAGDTYTDTIKLTLSLHGISQEINSEIQVTKLTHQRLLITSVKPIIISAKDYSLLEGVEKLRKAANLPSISTAVPVTYNLVFQNK